LEIGKIMGVSRHTTDKYGRALREKFGVSTRLEVVVEAFRHGLVA
jgi:DNA-binding CsgD family transcriptional regulator